jgi:hypothetical protein
MSFTRRLSPFLVIVCICLQAVLSDDHSTNNETETEEPREEEPHEEEIEPATAVLFPWFILALSVIIYYILSRYAKWLPYTAMCFLLGYVHTTAVQFCPLTTAPEAPVHLGLSVVAQLSLTHN